MPSIPLGLFYIQTSDGQILFQAELGPDGATPTDGYGGWAVTGRPKREGLTEWGGRNPYAFDLDFTIDALEEGDGAGTERAIARLESMAGIDSYDEPPTVMIDAGGAIPHDLNRNPGWRYVIENIGFDKSKEIRLGNTGNRVFVRGTISLRKYVRDEALGAFTAAERARRKKASKKKAEAKGGKSSKAKRYTVKTGDTLSKIAYDRLGKSSRWTEIANLNGIRDPRRIHPGQVLKLP
jgi:LysM repeat protein